MPASGGIARFQTGDEDDDQNAFPDTAQRRFGDSMCCFFFLLCLIFLGVVQFYSFLNGSLERYEGLTDYDGKFCGLSSSVVDKPYLYFCQEVTEGLRLRENRICVSSCDVATRLCPNGESSKPYSAFNYAGILCLPEDPDLRATIGKLFLADPDLAVFLLGTAFTRAWPAIFISMVCSIVLAFIYLSIINRCKGPAVLCGLAVIVLMGVAGGLLLVDVSHTGGTDGITSTGDEVTSFWVGVILFAVTACLLCVCALWGNNLKVSIACLKAGTECIWDSPSIVFEPFMHLSIQLVVLLALVAGLLKQLTWLQYEREDYEDGVSIRVHFDYSPVHIACLAYYIWMCIWIMEVLYGLSYVSTSYAAQLWFFASYDKVLNSKDVQPYAACKGFAVCLRYHLATIIYGAGIIPLLRLPRCAVGAVFYAVSRGEPNAVTNLIGKVCSCCFMGYDGMLRFMTPWAYMDVSLNGSRFCKAAYFATTAMDHQAVKQMATHSAAWLVQFVGHVLVAATGGIVTYILCSSGQLMRELGMEPVHSDFYVPRPSVMGVFAALICWGTAHPFLVLPSYIADNILFCHAIERQRFHSHPIQSSASMFAGLTSCGGRTQEHTEGSTRAQPPATHALLEEAKHLRSAWNHSS